MKTAAYCRYSSDSQREESIDAQLRAIKEYAKKESLDIIKVYIDEARSATTDNRPQFLKMIEDVKKGHYQAVIVHKMDRFARNRYDSAFYKKTLKDNKVKLISVLERFDDSPESILLESLTEGLAEYYSANLARETMKGLKENAYSCKFNGGKPPFGFSVDKETGKYIINELEAEMVKTIFKMYSEGYTYREISDTIVKKGFKKFAKNSIHDMLRNEKYYGTYIFNKANKKNKNILKPSNEWIVIENGLPAIVSKELFNEVNKRMEEQKKASGETKAVEPYLLSGILYCGECGSAMVGNRKTVKGNVYSAYYCGRKKRSFDCKAKSIVKEKIEGMIIEDFHKYVISELGSSELAEKIFKHSQEQNQDIINEVSKLNNDLKNVQMQIDNIVNVIANGIFNTSLKEKLDSLEAQKSEIQAWIFEAERQHEKYGYSMEQIKAFLAHDRDFDNKSDFKKKRILKRYINKISLYPDRIETEFVVDFDNCGTRARTLTG